MWGFGLAQLGWIVATVVVAMFPVGIVYAANGGEPNYTMLLQMGLTVPFSYLLSRWAMPALAARTFGRRIRPGSYPLYGAMHLAVWVVGRAMSLSPMPRLAGSPYALTYLRWCGARIGPECHLGTAEIPLPTMLEVGRNVTVGYATHLAGYEIRGGYLHVGRIQLGDDVMVGANSVLAPGAVLGAGAVLGNQSLVPEDVAVPAGEFWDGSPATNGSRDADPVVTEMLECDHAPRDWGRAELSRFRVSILALELVPMVALIPSFLLVWATLMTFDHIAALLMTLATGPLFVITACTLILMLRRFALERTPVGIHHLRSTLGVEKWFSDQLLSVNLELTNSLFGTLYTPHWLRRLGANIGKHAEIATIANIDPDLLTLGEGAFVADMGSVGSAIYANGHVAFRPTTVGDRAFVGNAAFVPSGSEMGDNSLIGVMSIPPTGGMAEGTSWLGSPAIYLPKREVYEEFDEKATFAPPRWKVVSRYVIEFFRACLPATILGLSTFGTLMTVSLIAAEELPLWVTVAATPLLALAFSVLTVFVIALMKWLIVGRYRPRVQALWSGFVRRTEFMTGIFETTAVPVLLQTLAGTPMLPPLLRLFGVRIGRRCLLDTTYITEFDLVTIGDDVSVGAHVSLQTHLFEDRVMKMGRVRLEDDSSIGVRGIVLYGATLGDHAELAPLSLVMKGESIPPATRWIGIPARPDAIGAGELPAPIPRRARVHA
nr:Pls/PosA family non-ribosomal peptide synthetase [Propioniciclava coleopterorum]